MEYIDTGGTVNIGIKTDKLDTELMAGQTIRVFACLSHGRPSQVKKSFLGIDFVEKHF